MHANVTVTLTISDRKRYLITAHGVLPRVFDIVEEEYDAYNRKWEEIGNLRLVSIEQLAAISHAANKLTDLQLELSSEEECQT
jgi:hypothetical protein